MSNPDNGTPHPPLPIVACDHCRRRPAVALFRVVEKVFNHTREHQMALCGECGFTIHQTRRPVYKDDEVYSVLKYSSVEQIALLSDLMGDDT